MRRVRRLAVVAGLIVAASMALATAAWAQPIREVEVVDDDTFIENDFCEVAGLTVRFHTTGEVRFMGIPHGPDGLVYSIQHSRITDVLTNLANGNTVTVVSTNVIKDLKVTDNGDGTLTILGLGTGNFVVYGPDGKAIARNPGQIRFEALVDHGGTPTDPSDDELISFDVVRESTGRNDDFCEAVIPVLLG
jgi:hypothetical protein